MEGYFRDMLQMSGIKDVSCVPPVVLAYIGDAVFELYIRHRVVEENSQVPVDKLHQLAVGYVNASAQSNIIHSIWDCLTEEEVSIVKKGRNAKSGISPRNAHMIDYRYATGFEALVGYLYLRGNISRLKEILNMAYENMDIN